MPPLEQRYNDDFRGWPVSPQHQQHPVRGTFLDPRPDPKLGAIYHTGVDVAVRDDRPEAGAPAGRTHRVFAIEGGVVDEATKPGVRGNVRIGHFGYGHVDARVKKGDRVKAGEFIGWTTKGSWHVHLTEFFFPGDGRRLLLNPLRPAGSSSPTSTPRRRSSTTSASTRLRHRPGAGASQALHSCRRPGDGSTSPA